MTAPRLLRPVRRALVTALVATTAVAGVTATGSTTHDSSSGTRAVAASYVEVSPSLGTSTYERRVQHWINVRRGQHGLGKLRISHCTDRIAERWGRHLAVNDEFYHQSMSRILNRCNAYYAGETLGRGAISPKHLVYLWMHSPEHRHILLSHYPTRIGIGAYPDRFGEWVVAADFMRP
ncbi:MAG TPA: CAP domain-containing protein [Nocardioidaceae bacterium]|nr:CAP domain-containing protein [Nocardioidaceae bacterium]